MARKKKHPGHVNHERWLISYADFITLLFAFFVVMYASSQTDRAKTIQLAAAIQTAFQQMGMFHPTSTQPPLDSSSPMPYSDMQTLAAIKPHTDMQRLLKDRMGIMSAAREMQLLATQLRQELHPQIQKKQVSVAIRKEGVVVSLREAGFYPSGSATLLPGSGKVLAQIAGVIRPHDNAVRIEGYTDNVPIHNAKFDSNWDLSTARASGLVKIFITQYGFDPARLSAAGYAQYHPFASNATAAGRQQNRRVDVVILPPPGSIWVPPDDESSAPAAAKPSAAAPRGAASPPPSPQSTPQSAPQPAAAAAATAGVKNPSAEEAPPAAQRSPGKVGAMSSALLKRLK